MNSIIKRVVSLFSSQEPQSDIPPPSAERKKTPDQSPVMNDPKPVSVVVSPPAFDLDSYESFDEDYFRRTVDEILSDQASFENSFDAYSGTKMMDGTCERKASMARDSGLGSSGHKASPYFPSKVAKKRPVAHRVIQKMESTEDEDDSEECQSGNKVVRREDPADSVVKIKLEQLEKRRLGDVGIYAPDNEVGSAARASSVIDVDACDDENFEEVSEERFVFASVSEEEHNRLVRFLVDHPFMREGAYPVKRSVRRRFISDVRREASYSGMDEGALGVLTKWIKKTYLEVCMVADADKEGSEFGDEIDDENVLEHRSRSKSKKDRKRKRTSIDQAREKTKTKKTKTKKSDISMVPSKQDVREVINIDSDDSAIAISKSPSTDIQVLEKAPVPQSDLQRTPTSHHIHPENAKHGRVVIEHATPKAPTTPSNHRGNERSISSKESSLPMPRYHNSTSKNDVNSNKRIQPASQEDIARKESSKKRTVSSADLPSSHSKDELQKIAENREKRKKKKKKKKKKRCDDKNKRRLDRQEKRRSEKSETIPERLTTCAEVRSKYFSLSLRQSKGGRTCALRSNTQLPKHSIPEETLLILKDLGLPPDFLSSGSDLSDIPDDTSSINDNPFLSHPTLRISPPRDHIVESFTESPRTPVNGASLVKSCVNPAKPALARPAKVSPYFPQPLVDPESCIPFPPIDADSFGLVQEQLAHDPFRLLIATIFLNRTRGGVALPVLFRVFERFPTVEAMATADVCDFVDMILCLGFQNQRTRKCISLAQTWMSHPPKKDERYRKLHYPCKLDGRDVRPQECIDDTDPRVAWEVAHLPGVGAYSLDSWRIFCRDELRGLAKDWKGSGAATADFVPEWKSVLPHDKELRAYLTWMWLKEGWVWDRQTGLKTRASEKMMRAARRGGVALEENGNWILETSPVKKATNGLTTLD
ncbi:unnamed protein product [Aspergillus oryzae]|nr:unnamed protein product [Aspergillus oryzae]GMF90136.1 unnamed protein product [Aspergillus oryzae]